jgi:hypothetical protein
VTGGNPLKRERCELCGKVWFFSDRDAREFINSLHRPPRSARLRRMRRARSPQLPKRVYPCPHGNGWHITHKEQRRRDD